jgi:tetratricopeptide (TPR) repeat protein
LVDGRIPRVVVDTSALRSLKISAADGFVLSRIDGRVTVTELASLTGLPELQIKASIDKLLSLKVIDFGPPAPAPSRPNVLGSAAAESSPQARDSAPQLGAGTPDDDPGAAAAKAASGLLTEAIARIPEDAPELAEAVDLPLELRRRIMGLHSVVTSLDHYAVLGIGRDADKKGVKRAYFELAALFHPDRYFRKNLGTFKAKMEVVFAKVSTAYETLVDKALRAEYDVYLGDLDKSRQVEAMLRNVLAEVAEAERVAVADAGVPGSMPPPAPAAEPAAPPPPVRSAVADQLRREALAMRLRGGAPRPGARPVTPAKPTTPPPVAPPAPMSTAQAMDALRVRYEERVEQGRRQQGQKYVSLGETAESRNDLTAAASAYRVALSFLREEDPAYAHAQEVIRKSEVSLGETYVRQADHEERANQWERALQSWSRAAKLRPDDPRAQERYANALVHESGDLHAAAQFAQRAVSLAPASPEYRCTLATVYMAAGLNLNARRELESAAQQFPESATVKALLGKLAKPA